MNDFAANLATLPPVDHILCHELLNAEGHVGAAIENRAGQGDSLRTYHTAVQWFGIIARDVARAALHLYADKVADARTAPGRHTNIDRPFVVKARHARYWVRFHEQGPLQ